MSINRVSLFYISLIVTLSFFVAVQSVIFPVKPKNPLDEIFYFPIADQDEAANQTSGVSGANPALASVAITHAIEGKFFLISPFVILLFIIAYMIKIVPQPRDSIIPPLKVV